MTFPIPKHLHFSAYVRAALNAAWEAGVTAFLVEGEPGTGKTDLGRSLGAWAKAHGGALVFSQANAWTTDESLIRGVDLAGFVEKDPDKVYAAGALLKAAQVSHQVNGPVVLLLDEWDKARPVADALLLAALEERIVVDSAGTVHDTLGANVIFWITSNATRQLAAPLYRRVLRMVLPPIPADLAIPIVRKKSGCGPHLAAAIVDLRTRCRTTITLPDMVRLAQVLVHANTPDAYEYLTTSLLRDDLTEPGFNPGLDLWAARGRDHKEK